MTSRYEGASALQPTGAEVFGDTIYLRTDTGWASVSVEQAPFFAAEIIALTITLARESADIANRRLDQGGKA